MSLFSIESFKRAKSIFISSYFNEQQQYLYAFTRHHLWSKAAIGLSLYNLFNIRQKIIKHAIYFTRSNNPFTVKIGTGFVGLIYFVGLLAVWHIPSFAAENSMRIYYACQDAVTGYFLSGQEIEQRIAVVHKQNELIKKLTK